MSPTRMTTPAGFGGHLFFVFFLFCFVCFFFFSKKLFLVKKLIPS